MEVNTQHVFGLALEVTGDMVKESGDSTADANEDDELESEGTSDDKGNTHTKRCMCVCPGRNNQQGFNVVLHTMKSAVVEDKDQDANEALGIENSSNNKADTHTQDTRVCAQDTLVCARTHETHCARDTCVHETHAYTQAVHACRERHQGVHRYCSAG
jgi:hypothetical protein